MCAVHGRVYGRVHGRVHMHTARTRLWKRPVYTAEYGPCTRGPCTGPPVHSRGPCTCPVHGRVRAVNTGHIHGRVHGPYTAVYTACKDRVYTVQQLP